MRVPVFKHLLGLARLVVLAGFSVSSMTHAGSYEDFFKAIKQDDAATVTFLLNRGFDANTINPAGDGGLFLALQHHSLKVAEVMLAWPETKVETRSPKDESPLMLAALHGLHAQSQELIARGADVNKTGWAPLHYAATHGHLTVMGLLLENHAYIDAASPNGTTPLMMAAHYGTPAAVVLLLEAGADPLLKNDQGLTAIDFAQRANRQESANLIAAFVRAQQPRGQW